MRYFSGILVFFLAFGWLALVFSSIGLFYTETVALSIILGAFFVIYFWPKIRQFASFAKGKYFYVIMLLSLAASIATCYFATPTIFGGRDQGSIATAAIELSKNHQLKNADPIAHDLFQKYGSGKSLNFPGFDYTKDGWLISRFPIGYTAYLASAYDLFGLNGIRYANAIPLFLFLVIFWLTLREFFDSKESLLGFLLAATFFPFLWFAKYTLTETYSLFLVWTGIYFLIRLSKEKDISLAWASLAFFALSALTRIEGMIFFLLAVVYILLLQRKNVFQKTKKFNKYLLVSTLFLLIVYLYLDYPTLLDSAKNFVKVFLPNSTKESVPSANLYAHLGQIFFSYNILPFIVIGLVGIFWLVVRFRKNWSKPEFLPLFITFPAFIYLISPMISLDDPWIFRRYVFAVFPVLIFYSVFVLGKFFRHKSLLYLSLLVLIVTNAAVSWRFFQVSENKGLLPQIEKISSSFGPDDLILVDRGATGSGFSLASEPLRTIYRKNAVYFFNAEDLSYVDQNRYKNIYLMGEFDAVNAWYAETIKGKPLTVLQMVNNNYLEPSDKKFAPAVNVESENFLGIWKLK